MGVFCLLAALVSWRAIARLRAKNRRLEAGFQRQDNSHYKAELDSAPAQPEQFPSEPEATHTAELEARHTVELEAHGANELET